MQTPKAELRPQPVSPSRGGGATLGPRLEICLPGQVPGPLDGATLALS